jgi:putative ABC transport system substrate-binding protein
MIRRRQFITLLGGAAVAWPLAVRAQGAGDLPRVAVLSPDPATTDRLPVFLGRLGELGYVDGRNIRLDTRFAGNRLDRLPALAAELVKARPAVIYTYSTPGTFAAAGATTSIPIVAGPTSDQAMEQLAGNFARPVANVTGFTLPNSLAPNSGVGDDELCLQLLKEAAPGGSRIALLVNPDNPIWRDYPNVLKAAADQRGLVLIRVDSRGAVDIGPTLSHYTNGTVDGLFLGDDPTLAGDSGVRAQVIEFAREQHLPSASTYNNYAREGGLLSLGTDMGPIFRSAAEYVHRIIHGARPSELPIQRATKFELVVNLKTAKALGLTIPPSILARADEVIE